MKSTRTKVLLKSMKVLKITLKMPKKPWIKETQKELEEKLTKWSLDL